MPPCSIPSWLSRLARPAWRRSATLPASSTPARCRASQYSRLRISTRTESMPRCASRCESSNPAGPAPTMPTWVRMSARMFAGDRPSERIRGDVAADGDPAGVGEGVQVGRAAEPRARTRSTNSAERRVRRVVDRLVVDVHDAGRDLPGELEAPHDVPGKDAEREPVLGISRELRRFVRGGEADNGGDRAEYLAGVGRHGRGYVSQHRRGVEQSLVGAARREPRASGDPGGDQAVPLAPLPLLNDRPQSTLPHRPLAD